MAQRKIDVSERPEIPWLSVVLGYGPMLPLVVGAAGVWTLSGKARPIDVSLTLVYAASILSFLAGVRRGLSFRTEGGPKVLQIATMFGIYVLALASLVATMAGSLLPAAGCALAGFVLVTILDPIAAKRGDAPLFFARLRPTQLPIADLSLAALLAAIWIGR